MIDVSSETWRDIKQWAEGEIKKHQAHLERLGLDEKATEGHRHAIVQLRLLLKLPEPSKIPATLSQEP